MNDEKKLIDEKPNDGCTVMGEGKKYYRCGWCGAPCGEFGEPLDVIVYDDTVRQIQEDCKKVELTNGLCCLRQQNMMQITREMALDAGDPELEGHWI